MFWPWSSQFTVEYLLCLNIHQRLLHYALSIDPCELFVDFCMDDLDLLNFHRFPECPKQVS